jgi:hypothetical protein
VEKNNILINHVDTQMKLQREIMTIIYAINTGKFYNLSNQIKPNKKLINCVMSIAPKNLASINIMNPQIFVSLKHGTFLNQK